MFTGDSSGDFLYSALHRAGFANQSTSIQRGDGLTLNDVFVSAVCRCAPPDNKPSSQEIENCLPFLDLEMVLLERLSGIVTLGRIAFEQTLGLLRQSNPKLAKLDFSHCAVYELGGDLPWIIASYHPSRQNTQTGRLTVEMFDQVWATVHAQLEPVRKKGE
jgi:uracil-DNA glycosylase family 4